MSVSTRIYWFNILWVLLGVCLYQRAAAVQTNDRDLVMTHAESRLSQNIDDWETKTATTIDPRLLGELIGEYTHFLGIFTYDKVMRDKVMTKIESDKWLNQVTHDHLNAISKSAPRIRTFFARLAEAVGARAEDAGWQSHMENSYVLNDLTTQLPDESFFLISEGLSTSRYRQHRKFLVGPGQHEIRSDRGFEWNFTVDRLKGRGPAVDQPQE
ncbi:MAG: hypothetical protein AB2696_17445 [Candidatus Thiodiazotropha sp.]